MLLLAVSITAKAEIKLPEGYEGYKQVAIWEGQQALTALDSEGFAWSNIEGGLYTEEAGTISAKVDVKANCSYVVAVKLTRFHLKFDAVSLNGYSFEVPYVADGATKYTQVMNGEYECTQSAEGAALNFKVTAPVADGSYFIVNGIAVFEKDGGYEPEPTLLYSKNGITDDMFGYGYKLVLEGNKIVVEAYDDDSYVVDNWDGVECSYLHFAVNRMGEVTSFTAYNEGAPLTTQYEDNAGWGRLAIVPCQNEAYDRIAFRLAATSVLEDAEAEEGMCFFACLPLATAESVIPEYTDDPDKQFELNHAYTFYWPYIEDVPGELVYKAVSRPSQNAEWDEFTDGCISLDKDVTIEVYDNNSIILRNWLGDEGADLKVKYDEDENVVAMYSIYEGVTEESQTEYGDYLGFFTHNEDYYYSYLTNGALVSCATSDNEAEKGYVVVTGYFYPDASSYEYLYYYIEWPYIPSGASVVVAEKEDGVMYNLMGQPVNENATGLLIKNGKKFYKK